MNISRRRILKLTGAVTSTAFVAGCSGNGGNGDGNDSGNGGDGGGGDGVEIEPGTQIEFDGQTPGWLGLAPDSIADEENPMLVLQEGETYEMGWTQGDGAQHNIEIRNENDEVVDDLQTEVVTEPEEQWLEFEASSEMVTYICEVHPTTMIGDIQVES
ncbi:twin-arginine translocation signal domain-containing protein [Halopiger xanaduensis]|uniref:Blue (Type 1) copper domain protein n=1 Tax=Halopiger xanaduensis (strain DSM 18323 / JCM 14033 / SH-6) TaxID=797210 RepID=F8DE77_HALXS|nr:twin-arginine translocation signal domain-containing protein [Halopiger xanaduensis]AEH39356.1 blue (type 1) copper domain protein [Halopiger xanaduensis SH-6]